MGHYIILSPIKQARGRLVLARYLARGTSSKEQDQGQVPVRIVVSIHAGYKEKRFSLLFLMGIVILEHRASLTGSYVYAIY